MTDPTAPDTLTEDDLLALDQLALERTKRKEAIDAETARVKQIDAILRDRLPAGTTTLGATKVTIVRGRQTLNAAKFAERFPPSAFPECYRTAPAPKADVEQYVGSKILEQAGVLDEGTPTVRVA